jgi:hypothetical protein
MKPVVDSNLLIPDLGWLSGFEFRSEGCFQWAKSNVVALLHHSWQGIGGSALWRLLVMDLPN